MFQLSFTAFIWSVKSSTCLFLNSIFFLYSFSLDSLFNFNLRYALAYQGVRNVSFWEIVRNGSFAHALNEWSLLLNFGDGFWSLKSWKKTFSPFMCVSSTICSPVCMLYKSLSEMFFANIIAEGVSTSLKLINFLV